MGTRSDEVGKIISCVTNMLICLLCSYHSNLQTKVRPLQAKVTSMKNSLTENISRLKVMEEKYEVHDAYIVNYCNI